MRALPLVAVFCCSCITTKLEASKLQPAPVLSSADLPRLPVKLSKAVLDKPACDGTVSVPGWREAVQRSVEKLGTPVTAERPGIVIDLMEPNCVTGHYNVVQVRYRARLLGPNGEELAATNGIANGTPFSALDWHDHGEDSLSLGLELATQEAIVPLLERGKSLSLSSSR
jgi:hypothetical protein